MTKKRHVDYVRDYAKNLVPVIPHDATLSPNSKIDPVNRGKVPGQRKADGTWYGGWKDLGVATMALARKWDEWGAYIGCRTGFDGVIALDVDLTCHEDAEWVLDLARQLFGKTLAVRRVDHPDHTKLLICLRLEGSMPAAFNLDIVQSNGKHAQIQFLGPGRYFNVHGVHPKRLRPYVWERDPADEPLTSVNLAEFEAFWTAIEQDFEITHRPRLHAFNEVRKEPERCTSEEMEALVELIPNDETFADYKNFIAMGAAMYGASGGADWGRIQWLAWCDQVDQPQEHKPESVWISMTHVRSGASELRMFANQRQPLEMARRDFADPPIEEVEPELVEQADQDAEIAKTTLNDWCLVGGSEFYSIKHPGAPLAPTAFGMVHARHEKALKRALGGDKRLSLAKLFARRSENLVDAVVHEPGKPRFIERESQRFLNLWSPPPRPRQGQPIDPKVIDFYRDLVLFVLGSTEETELWFNWHAWMLQNPDKAPGWQWVVQSGPGLGKDLILHPIGLAHGADYTPITPRDLAAPYNDYAERHLISASEMKMRSTDDGPYLTLKAITSGGPTISIRVQYRRRYLAANVAGFVIFSNEEHPLKIDHDDRRLHVASNFDVNNRTPEYYIHARKFLTQHWAMLGEFLLTRPLGDAVNNLITGNAPATDAKREMAEQIAERAILDIIGEIESDKPPPHYLPVATTSDVRDWLEKIEKLRPYEIPNRNELPGLLYRLGARPLNPHPKKPKRAEPIGGAGRLWRLAKTWNGWSLENATPARLAKLYSDRAMPPADLKAVDESEV